MSTLLLWPPGAASCSQPSTRTFSHHAQRLSASAASSLPVVLFHFLSSSFSFQVVLLKCCILYVRLADRPLARPTLRSYWQGEYVSCLLSLLRQMTDVHFQRLVENFQSKEEVKVSFLLVPLPPTRGSCSQSESNRAMQLDRANQSASSSLPPPPPCRSSCWSSSACSGTWWSSVFSPETGTSCGSSPASETPQKVLVSTESLQVVLVIWPPECDHVETAQCVLTQTSSWRRFPNIEGLFSRTWKQNVVFI